ncbi:hypothetical protein ACFQX8_05365 [Klenkia terrae]
MSSVLLVFLILLFARFVVDWVMVLARSWRPRVPSPRAWRSSTQPPIRR